MATNQEGVHAAIRASTGTARDYIADWHALFDDASIASGTFNERLLAWINAQLSTSYVSLPTAMQAYAVDAGFARWSDINTLSLGGGAVSLAETLAGSETDALAIVYTDTFHKATTGFNGSVFCVDSGTPANDYDSSPTTEAANYFTITSPSPKMILHDDGVLKYNAHNLSLMSESFSDATWTKFESSIDDNGGGGYSDFTGGTNAVQLVESSNTNIHYVFQSLSYVSGVTYNHVCVAKANTRSVLQIVLSSTSSVFGVSGGYANFDLSGGSVSAASANVTGTITSLGGGWYKCEARATAQATVSASYAVAVQNSTSAARAASYAGDGSSGLYIHRSHIHRYPADTTYLKTTSAARYADPIEFNSSGTALGALVEPADTNLCTYSKDWTNAAWVAENLETLTAATGPDGTSSAWAITPSTANDYHRIYRNNNSGNGAYQSFFVKANGLTKVGIKNSAAAEYATFNLTTASLISTTGMAATPTIEETASGWYRIKVQFSTNFNWGLGVYPLPDSYTSGDPYATFTGNGTDGIICAFSQTSSTRHTSYIETFGSTVTRAADNISKATSGFATDTANMTLYARWTPRGLAAGVANTQPVNLNNNSTGGTASIFALYTNASGDVYTFLNNSSGTQANIDSGSNVSLGTSLRAACAYASNNVNIAVNGTAGTADTSAGVMNSITTLNVGSGELGAAGQLNGHIQEILILPRRVSDADMQTLTSTGSLP